MLSVFTPTYNRKHLLQRLYNSLKKQICLDFEWIVVDDGSTDGTEKLIKSYAENSDFPIIYHYQENSGKHIAHNKGVMLARGELFLCLDSDDVLANENTVADILNTWKKVGKKIDCAGMISYKSDVSGMKLGLKFPSELEYSTAVDLNIKYNCNGERCYTFRTDLLKKNLYPYFKGEKFCPDSYISDILSRNYCFYLRHSVDEICEYQSDGLSLNFKILMAHSSKAFSLCNMQLIDMECTFSKRFIRGMYYWGFLFLKYDKSIKYDGKHRFTVYLSAFPGVLLSLYYRVYRLRGL